MGIIVPACWDSYSGTSTSTTSICQQEYKIASSLIEGRRSLLQTTAIQKILSSIVVCVVVNVIDCDTVEEDSIFESSITSVFIKPRFERPDFVSLHRFDKGSFL